MAIQVQNQQLAFEFGPFRLEPAERLLLCDDRPVKIAPKAFDVLVVLVKNRGRLITKRELIDEVWTEVVVEEANLQVQVSAIRKALADDQNGNKFIETVAGKGYRFIAPTTVVESSSETKFAAENTTHSESPAAKRPVDSISQKRFRTPIIAAIIVLTLAGIALGIYLRRSERHRNSVQPTLIRIPAPPEGLDTGFYAPLAISPDGKRVAYATASGGVKALVVCDIQPASRNELVKVNKGSFVSASFSPDGKYVYYVLSAEGHPEGDLYRVPASGGDAQKLLVYIGNSFTFSPDGKYLAYSRHEGYSRVSELFLASADGQNERKISSHDAAIVSLSWSPDGKSIACATVDLNVGTQGKLTRVLVEDGTEQVLSSKVWHDLRQIAWRPQGDELVVIAKDEYSAFPQVWAVEFPSGNAGRITDGREEYRQLSVTADGKLLATFQRTNETRIWTASVKEVARATQIVTSRSESSDVAWTSDERIIFVDQVSGNGDLWLCNPDGSNLHRLTSDPHDDFMPNASPDGRYFVFASNRAGSTNIWRIDADGSNPRQLTTGSVEYFPRVSPDNKWVVFSSFTENKMSIFRVPLEGGNSVQLTRGFVANAPEISPDGKKVACTSAFSKVAIIPFDGGEPVQFVDYPRQFAHEYLWNREGDGLVFLVTENGISKLIERSLIESGFKPLTDFQIRISNFALSGDGDIAYTTGNSKTEILLLSDSK